MCGIGGVLDPQYRPVPDLAQRLELINRILRHRGPDGEGIWTHPSQALGFAHRRLSIIDVAGGAQPMHDGRGNWITFNGEIYNYRELRDELGPEEFRTSSDTEVILRAYEKWGADCVTRFRGMFAFALWDERRRSLFCAKDRFGIKPFYYAMAGGMFHFASEIKALLPVLPSIETDAAALHEYLAFQFCLPGKTLFQGVQELPAAHTLEVRDGAIRLRRYWEVDFNDLDFDHSERYFERELGRRLAQSIDLHLRSDVPIGAYVSGGLDSALIATTAAQMERRPFAAFHGRFAAGPAYDESGYARIVAGQGGFDLHEIEITADDFVRNIERVIYHLDFPVAGPGSFAQYMVSALAARHRKVVLGGQGGDEIFGGYTRYLIAYFEQCIKAAIDGTMHDGNFLVTYESIIPNLTALRNYKPLMQEFWRDGLFEEMDLRYFRLINRAPGVRDEIRWDELGETSPLESFRAIFNGGNVPAQAYFDKMTHFDFKTLLPALLQVEDRVSMAHGLESRVPFLDHPLVEFAATVRPDVKFKNGTLKNLLVNTARPVVPPAIVARTDKMGFPVPVTAWIRQDAREFVHDILGSSAALTRPFVDGRAVLRTLDAEGEFGRKAWGFLSLELWQRVFHDRAAEYRRMLATAGTPAEERTGARTGEPAAAAGRGGEA
jgi:asparagine synthase (glutamine-hydrolysing)